MTAAMQQITSGDARVPLKAHMGRQHYSCSKAFREFCSAAFEMHWCAMDRWLLKAPTAASDDWVMEFRASRDIAPGEELLNSYGERRCRP